MRDAEAIVEQITAAFAGTEPPGREALFNNHCCECAEVSGAFAGRLWTEITLQHLLEGRETALLTAAAWRYYLPAMMVWCVREPDAVDVIQDNLVYQLEPPGDDYGVPEWFNERAAGFSDEQRAAIAAYLDWYRERDEARWGGGEPPPHVYRALAHWTADFGTGSAGSDGAGGHHEDAGGALQRRSRGSHSRDRRG